MTRVEMLLVCAVVVSALGVVSAQHQARKLYTEFEREQARAHQFEVEWGQLQLEQSTQGALARIEGIARERIGLAEPSSGRIVVVGEGL